LQWASQGCRGASPECQRCPEHSSAFRSFPHFTLDERGVQVLNYTSALGCDPGSPTVPRFPPGRNGQIVLNIKVAGRDACSIVRPELGQSMRRRRRPVLRLAGTIALGACGRRRFGRSAVTRPICNSIPSFSSPRGIEPPLHWCSVGGVLVPRTAQSQSGVERPSTSPVVSLIRQAPPKGCRDVLPPWILVAWPVRPAGGQALRVARHGRPAQGPATPRPEALLRGPGTSRETRHRAHVLTACPQVSRSVSQPLRAT
jgi:hypothetical protein